MQQEGQGVHREGRQVCGQPRRADREGSPLPLQDRQLQRAAQQIHGRVLQVQGLP